MDSNLAIASICGNTQVAIIMDNMVVETRRAVVTVNRTRRDSLVPASIVSSTVAICNLEETVIKIGKLVFYTRNDFYGVATILENGAYHG